MIGSPFLVITRFIDDIFSEDWGTVGLYMLKVSACSAEISPNNESTLSVIPQSLII